MPEGLIYAIAIFALLLATNIIILFLFRRRDIRRNDATDPHRANIIKTKLDLRRAEAGMGDYERQSILDMLRDQLKYSQEDYSELQQAMKQLTTQQMILEGKIENLGASLNNRMDKMTNRLDNFLMLITKLSEK